MTPDQLLILAIGVLVVAFLYSSVGHAGASGYIAVMSLLSLSPEVIKPTALTLNILVASIGTLQFWRAGYFSWRLFWPFALLAVPMALVGGYLNLPAQVFKILVGVILWYSAVRFLMPAPTEREPSPPPLAVALGSGGFIGLFAGFTGTGGGIFLTPLLLLAGWARVKTAAAVSALFILCNSIAGLVGNIGSTKQFPTFALVLVAAAAVGGTAGSYLGSRRFDPAVIKRLLAVVLVIAGTKLVLA